MGYKDKKIRKEMFQNSLKELLTFAYAFPVLSLKYRRALVEAIAKGGSLGNRHKKHTPQLPYALNYQYTQQGLLRACSDKMISYPRISQNIRKTICKLSALSAWAASNSNYTENIFDLFAKKMCPEDALQTSDLPIVSVISRNFHNQLKKESGEKLGIEKSLDFITCSGNSFYKKYGRM